MKFFIVLIMMFTMSCKPSQTLELETYKKKSALATDSETRSCDDVLEQDFSINCLQQAQRAGIISTDRFDEIYQETNTGSCFIGAVTTEEVVSIKDGGFCTGPQYSSALPVQESIAPVATPEPVVAPTTIPVSTPEATSGPRCPYINKCWGFLTFKWFNSGESSNGYTCTCGIWLPSS